MKNKILVSVLMAIGLFLMSLQINTLSAQTTKAKSGIVQTTKYTCPHHSDKINDKPGKCECGLDLVELKPKDKDIVMKSSDKNKGKMMPESKDMHMKDNKMMKKDSTKMMKDKM